MTFRDRRRAGREAAGGSLSGDCRVTQPDWALVPVLGLPALALAALGLAAKGLASRRDCPVTSNRPARQPRPGPTRSRQRVRPLPQGTSLYTPGASPARQATEHRSARTLIYLHQLPRWIAPLLLVVFLIAGLAVRGPVGAVALCLVAAVLAWLAALSWPRLPAGGRAGRVLAVVIMLALAGYQASR